jgi:hypothetical protein
MNKIFGTPTQVIYLMDENDCGNSGIAYHESIICGDSGKIIDLRSVYHIYELRWKDLSKDILHA